MHGTAIESVSRPDKLVGEKKKGDESPNKVDKGAMKNDGNFSRYRYPRSVFHCGLRATNYPYATCYYK